MTIQLLTGDCRDVLPTLPAESVHCVVTSPPYYGLRDYGTAQWDGGDAACDHGEVYRKRRNEQRVGDCGDGGIRRSERDPQTAVCKCGARRIDRQIGLEATPDAWLATMVQVFREVKRVLRPDGTCWVNIGDSYASTKVGNTNGVGETTSLGMKNEGSIKSARRYGAAVSAANEARRSYVPDGLKPKDLLLMPARLALALQQDGWWIRSDIIWHKPNPMPESVVDRPVSSHEHVFLLTKSARYFYDADAVRESAEYGRRDVVGSSMWNRQMAGDPRDKREGGSHTVNGADPSSGRNLRNVWTLATQAFPDVHYATFPTALVERCIKAGTSERGCCAACGKPWVRVVEKSPVGDWRSSDRSADLHDGAKGGPGGVMPGWEPARTTGWSPGCKCDAGDPVPATVLDCFLGSGTTALVADRLQRHAIGIDLSLTYAEMAQRRIEMDAGMFADLAPVPEPPEDERMADLFEEAAE